MKKKIAGLVIIFLTVGCIGAAGFWQERNRKEDTENLEEQSQETLADMVKIDEYEEKNSI